MQDLAHLKTRTDKWQGRFQALFDQVERDKKEVERAREDLSTSKGAISLLQYVAAETSRANEEQTAALATLALRETFTDETLSLVVEHSVKRGHPGVTFKIRDEDIGAEGDPMESFGGGPAALIGVVLQVISTVRQPGMARVLILDEPLSQVSSGYGKKAGQFLRKLCDPTGLGFKMLVVTHSDDIAEAAHKRYRAKKERGILTLEETDE